jgi:AraC-like DNA-binding protein
MHHYEEYRPEPALARFISCYWFLSGPAPDRGPAERMLQPIVPDGRMELVLHLADPFLRHHRDGSVERQSASLLAGQITEFIVVEPSGAVDVVGIRFQSAGAASLLPVPLYELRDTIVDSSHVAGELSRDLADRLHAAKNVAARVRVLNAHFAALQKAAAEQDRAVTVAVDLIHGCNGRLRIGELASQLGMTRRTLERRFLPAVGVGPKLLARIARFQHAFRQLQVSEPGAWSHIAHRCGYYDQAHLIQDFHAFAGASPSRFLAGQTTLADFFASAESS